MLIDMERFDIHERILLARLRQMDFEHTLRGDVRNRVLQSVRDNFTSSTDERGRQWKPRKVRGDGHPLLIDTGKLLQAATGGGAGHYTKAASRELEVGIFSGVVSYAKYHETGTSKMPARPFMGVSERRLEEIDEIVADAGMEVFEW